MLSGCIASYLVLVGSMLSKSTTVYTWNNVFIQFLSISIWKNTNNDESGSCAWHSMWPENLYRTCCVQIFAHSKFKHKMANKYCSQSTLNTCGLAWHMPWRCPVVVFYTYIMHPVHKNIQHNPLVATLCINVKLLTKNSRHWGGLFNFIIHYFLAVVSCSSYFLGVCRWKALGSFAYIKCYPILKLHGPSRNTMLFI